MTEDHRLERLRKWFLVLAIVVVFLGAAAPIGVVTWLEHRVDKAQFEIACDSVEANIEQLQALRAVARTLGLPHDTVIVPDLPSECM